MMFIISYGLNWMKVVEVDMIRNCSRDDLDLIAENMCSVILEFTEFTEASSNMRYYWHE